MECPHLLFNYCSFLPLSAAGCRHGHLGRACVTEAPVIARSSKYRSSRCSISDYLKLCNRLPQLSQQAFLILHLWTHLTHFKFFPAWKNVPNETLQHNNILFKYFYNYNNTWIHSHCKNSTITSTSEVFFGYYTCNLYSFPRSKHHYRFGVNLPKHFFKY